MDPEGNRRNNRNDGRLNSSHQSRNAFAFFFLGLTNNFGYVIMLSSAHDLLDIIDNLSEKKAASSNFLRECNEMSTGAILLADIVPCMAIKFVAPFIPLWIHFRMAGVVLTAALGILLVGMAINKYWIITGICLVSFSQGLGESSILAYTVFFKSNNVLSTWSSGTGLAGLLGSFAYSTMIQLGVSPQTTIFTMLCMPVTMAVNFWFVVRKPETCNSDQHQADQEMLPNVDEKSERNKPVDPETSKQRLGANIKSIPAIIATYTLWYSLIYLFEYFINQGLYELVYIPGAFLDHSAQYRWYNTLYQLGVFVSRSSMSLLLVDRLYMMALFQGINVVIFLGEAMYGYINYLPIVFIIILWEGLLAGAGYLHTYRRITVEWPKEGQQFAMAINSIGDSITTSIAGLLALPVHNAICRTPPTYGASSSTYVAQTLSTTIVPSNVTLNV